MKDTVENHMVTLQVTAVNREELVLAVSNLKLFGFGYSFAYGYSYGYSWEDSSVMRLDVATVMISGMLWG